MVTREIIVNRMILRKHIDDEVIINRIMNKAQLSLDINSFCRMGKSKTGAISSYVHFDINEWIAAQEKHLKNPTIKKGLIKGINKVLRNAKRVRDILEDEAKEKENE